MEALLRCGARLDLARSLGPRDAARLRGLSLESWASYKAREAVSFAGGEPFSEGLREAVVFFNKYRVRNEDRVRARAFVTALSRLGVREAPAEEPEESAPPDELRGRERAAVFREYFKKRRDADEHHDDQRGRSSCGTGRGRVAEWPSRGLERGRTLDEWRVRGEAGNGENEGDVGPGNSPTAEGDDSQREEEWEGGSGFGPWGSPSREDGKRGRRRGGRDGSREEDGSRGRGGQWPGGRKRGCGSWNFERGPGRWPG